MHQKTELKLMLHFTIAYLLFFTTLSLIKKNFEFLYYTSVISILIFIIVLYHKKMHLSVHIIGSLTALGAMHIFGGNLYFGETRLYDI